MRRDGFSFHVSVFNTLLSASLNDDWKRCQLLMTFFHEMPQCLWAGFCRQDGDRLLFFVRLLSVLLSSVPSTAKSNALMVSLAS